VRVDSGGVRLHVEVSGPEDGPAVVLLHGFPDTGRLWSKQVPGDFALTETQMTGSAALVSGSWRYERIDGPGHWMQWEAPDQVNALLLDFFAN
jgi:pimeloyl-ACP methyl ester carboxylesterase